MSEAFVGGAKMKFLKIFLTAIVIISSTVSEATLTDTVTDRELYAAQVYKNVSTLKNIEAINQTIEASGLSKSEILGAAIRTGQISSDDLKLASVDFMTCFTLATVA